MKRLLILIGIILPSFGILLGQNMQSGYAPVNSLKMYYEIHGTSQENNSAPLVLLHGGGSTIETTFGKILPFLSKSRRVVAVELRGHGHTPDAEGPYSFEQDADDVASLLHYLKINNADFMGFSNGGNTTIQIAIRYPELIRKLVVIAAGFKHEGYYSWLWDALKNAKLENMPSQLKEAYLKVAPNPENLINMHNKDAQRMNGFKDLPNKDIQSIHAPVLLIIGDADVVKPEHAVEMYRLFPNSSLTILPGLHGEYIGEVTTAKENSKIPELAAALIQEFLDSPLNSKGEAGR